MSTKVLEAKVIPAHPRLLTFAFDRLIGENSQELEQGKLKFLTGAFNFRFQATSGLPGLQSLASSVKLRKGRIPTCFQAQIKNYFVSTKPVYLPHVKGVNGNFYPITPFAVSVGKFQRSDLGIHKDTNVPGSAGCIVIGLDDHWELFEIEMKKLLGYGIAKIPLIVS